jgi:hypothetical protein
MVIITLSLPGLQQLFFFSVMVKILSKKGKLLKMKNVKVK